MKINKLPIIIVVLSIILPISGCTLNKKENIDFENEISKDNSQTQPIKPIPEEQRAPEVTEVPKVALDIAPTSEPIRNKTAYLTFDDGPSTNNTTTNLETLKRYGIKATFFVLPHDNIDVMYKRITEEGHVIGNHSYSHKYNYLYGSIDDFNNDVLKAQDYIYKKTNFKTSIYRFPGGSMGINKTVIQQRIYVLKQHGYRYFDWDVTIKDTETNLKKYGNDEGKIVELFINNILNNTKEKEKLIVLMHDDAARTYTAKALPSIIDGLIKQGYKFDVLTNY